MSSSLKDDVFNAVYGHTPKFSKPTPPPPPKTRSSVQVKKKSCTYETPCGWCTKWDKKCDKKIEKTEHPYGDLFKASHIGGTGFHGKEATK